MSEWLSKLKVGDKVLVTSGSGFNAFHGPGKVDRVTKTQVIVGSRKYSKKHGGYVGYRWGGRISPFDADAVEAIERQDSERETNKICNRFRSYRWHELELETLRAIAALLPGKEGE